MDTKYCILLVLASFLEEGSSFGESHLGDLLFGAPGQDPKNLNTNAYGTLKSYVLGSDKFVRVVSSGNLGTHSFKKFGTNHAHRCRCSMDDVDIK
eukprot:5634350-Ditylum_brightwellii.AAC.1